MPVTLPTYLLHATELFLRTNRISVIQEIPLILRNQNFHYRIHKCPPPFPIMSHFAQQHTPTSHFLKIHLNIILPSHCWSPKWFISLRFPQHTVNASPIPYSVTCQTHLIFLDLINRKLLSGEYRSLSTPLFSFFTPICPISTEPKYSPEHFNFFFFPHALISTALI